MTRSKIIFALLLASTATVAQETYKCKTAGGPVYQDRPCAGVRYAPEVPPVARPISAAPAAAAPQSDLERSKAYLASREKERQASDKERRVHELNEEILRQEESIAASRTAMDAEIAFLHQRKGTANNNLAGATFEQSVSTEMQAVVSRYNGEISHKQDRVKQLRDEIARLK